MFLVDEQICKPSSVLNNHLSRPIVTNGLKRYYPKAKRATFSCFPIRSCSRWGLHSRKVAIALVSSYLAFPPLPKLIPEVYLCCTFLQVTLTGSYPAPCPMELGLSSPAHNAAAIVWFTRK